MLMDPNEVLRAENNGLQSIVSLLKPLPAQFGVAPGDVLSLAGLLAVLVCPGGPVINAFVGRPAPRSIAPDGLFSIPESPVQVLTDRFADMGSSIRDSLMALIGAHSTGKQRFVNPAQANTTFDTTVDIWDDSAEIDLGTFKLGSNVNGNASTGPDLDRFIGKQAIYGTDTQEHRLRLTDCSEILLLSTDLTPLAVTPSGTGSNKPATDPVIDPVRRRSSSSGPSGSFRRCEANRGCQVAEERNVSGTDLGTTVEFHSVRTRAEMTERPKGNILNNQYYGQAYSRGSATIWRLDPKLLSVSTEESWPKKFGLFGGVVSDVGQSEKLVGWVRIE
ncbi:heme peroxidase [Mycena vulgaris]|nr:heme peroxidase [Mycena vulgaris]